MAGIEVLACDVMPYAWGSRTAIAELTGRPSPSPGPEAEMWMGAHPMLPSRLGGRSLAAAIESDATTLLGASTAKTYGPRLPFLLKVLAAAQPLSLQAHPNMEQAKAGFAEEEARGIARDAPTRNYRDASHKPELLAALTPVDALCGFRTWSESVELFRLLGADDLVEGTLHASFERMMKLDPARVATIEAACARSEHPSCVWAVKLAALYPGDPGVVTSLLLNLVTLSPGEALYLEAGNLHAYLDGTGVEIMASSDNVLRGGLTKKHVDVPELLRVLDFRDGPARPLRARPDGPERVFETPAAEFRLSVIDVEGNVPLDPHGPEILLCTKGAVSADGVSIKRGAAAFVPGSTKRYQLDGTGVVYRATTNA